LKYQYNIIPFDSVTTTFQSYNSHNYFAGSIWEYTISWRKAT